jgi:hypothetical protein
MQAEAQLGQYPSFFFTTLQRIRRYQAQTSRDGRQFLRPRAACRMTIQTPTRSGRYSFVPCLGIEVRSFLRARRICAWPTGAEDGPARLMA